MEAARPTKARVVTTSAFPNGPVEFSRTEVPCIRSRMESRIFRFRYTATLGITGLAHPIDGRIDVSKEVPVRFKILIFVILIGFLIGASRVSANDAYLADDAAALQGSGGGGAPMPGIYSGSCGSSSCAFQLRPGFSFTNPFPRTIAVGQHLMIDVFLKNDSITDAIFPLHDNISSLALVAAGDLGNVDPGATLGTQPQCLGYGAPALWLELRFGTTYSTPGLHTVTVTAYQCGPIGAGVPDSGQVIGTAFSHSFQINVMPTSVELVDPAPGLISGTTLTTSTGALATGGRIVSGSAADGVTQALIRIKTANPGEQFAVTLLDDHQTPAVQSTSSAEDGALGNPGDTNFSQSQINVISSSPGGSGPAYAFAVYRAPIEFARPFGSGYRSGLCRGQTASDDQLACRSVSVQVQDLTTSGTAPVTFSILIVRPPVALIHGLWADWKIWNAFSPLVSSKSAVDPRFSVLRVDFSNPVGTSLTSSTPQYSIGPNSARANSLGFQYNAPGVLKQISDWIQQFRLGNNRAGAAVAATQVDIVTHSMGANLARTMVLLPQFLNSPTFNQGVIHKVVTIDAPHLGSPLAAQLLGSTSDCTRELLASNENYTFTSVTISGRGSVNGGVGDLVGNGTAVD